jgi:hypothetical protein
MGKTKEGRKRGIGQEIAGARPELIKFGREGLTVVLVWFTFRVDNSLGFPVKRRNLNAAVGRSPSSLLTSWTPLSDLSDRSCKGNRRLGIDVS